ncbi:MAG: hypothetical protein K2X57_29170 [Xanthobacteraceae bacterium]|nr:hypothetical protein [Xanthobacteraceae bacterium]
MGDLAIPVAGDPVKRERAWPDAAFAQLLALADGPAAIVSGTGARIGLPAEARSIAAWHIAGVRIDAGAPGLSDAIRAEFGRLPQIRLIVQPVLKGPQGEPRVQDIAVHLIYSFTDGQDPPAQEGCLMRPKPDLAAFDAIVRELSAIKAGLTVGRFGAHRIDTGSAPLGVHPGLRDATTSARTRSEMKAFLERHLSGAKLGAMAVMGLPAEGSRPWIFLSMARLDRDISPTLKAGDFIPVHGPAMDGSQFAQMLNPGSAGNAVVPAPSANNGSAITCRHAALPVPAPPVAERKGVATAELFDSSRPSPARIREILDTLADPDRSHFFNTDCVSCHTDTRRAMELLQVRAIPGLDGKVLPNGSWNVRNFGWSPPVEGAIQATATRRTAAETDAVVRFINAKSASK